MKQIGILSLHQLRNNEHYQFMSEVNSLIVNGNPATLGIEAQYSVFDNGFAAEGTAIQVEIGSSHTKLIANLDTARDQVTRGFELQVESYKYHWDASVAEAARRIGRIVAQYGNLRTKSYNEESSGITNLVNEISAVPYNADLETLQLVDWVGQVSSANDNFKSLFGERANEQAARASGDVRVARAQIDPAYNALVTRVNALAVVNGEADYTEFIDRVNYYIDYYKNVIASRKGRNGGEGETPEPTK